VKAPRVSRPKIPAGYGVSGEMQGALRWISVRRVLEGSLRYWIATSSNDDGPHIVQQWAGWVDDTLYFSGSDRTKWSRHLMNDPRAAVSIERTGYSIMVEGRAECLSTVTPELAAALMATFNKKYGYKTTPEDWTKGGLWAIHAHKVFAWKFAKMGTTATRFLFDQPGATAGSPSNRAPSAIRVS
jgi:nitroimidazol reductase NimA-like FMN-containing flavoprotein (pyridoxamine 5'-phosphate oxidase superfamily)